MGIQKKSPKAKAISVSKKNRSIRIPDLKLYFWAIVMKVVAHK